MDRIYEISMLLDFYGQLLTDSQYECLNMHHNHDLSLAEIANDLKISRQGVHDFIKRGRQALFEYEEKLGLLKRFLDVKEKLESIQNDFDFIYLGDSSDSNAKLIESIKSRVVEIIVSL